MAGEMEIKGKSFIFKAIMRKFPALGEGDWMQGSDPFST